MFFKLLFIDNTVNNDHEVENRWKEIDEGIKGTCGRNGLDDENWISEFFTILEPNA